MHSVLLLRRRWLACALLLLCVSAGMPLGAPAAAASAAIPDQPRIVTLAPSTTELVFAAGAGKYIVGTVLSSDYPPAAKSIPRVGDGIQFSAETIIALRPSVVIGWQTTPATQALAAKLKPLGIPVTYSAPQSLEQVVTSVIDLGQRFGTLAHAQAVASDLQRRLQALERYHNANGQQITVFLQISQQPLYALGNDPVINDLIERCGGSNIYAKQAIAAPQVSLESVLSIQPELVIIAPEDPHDLAASQAWWASYGLRAALNHNFIAINPDLLYRPGPRLLAAAEIICQGLASSARH